MSDDVYQKRCEEAKASDYRMTQHLIEALRHLQLAELEAQQTQHWLPRDISEGRKALQRQLPSFHY